MDRTLVEDVHDEQLDRATAHPVIGLKLAHQSESIPPFESRKHPWRERADGILADPQLELSMRTPFPDTRRFDHMRIDEERRRREGFSKRSESLEVLDGWDSKRASEGHVDVA